MLRFIIKRLFYGVLVLLGVIIIVFFLFNVLPGDPARMMLGQRADAASIDAINKDLGRDKPLTVQFLMYLNDVSPISAHQTLNLQSTFYLSPLKYIHYLPLYTSQSGYAIVLKQPYLRRSYQSKKQVTEIILEALPGTAVLTIAAMLLATILGISLGVWAAVNKNSIIDRFSLVFSILGMSAPSFFAGILIAWLFGFVLSKYTGLNMTGSLYSMNPFDGEVLELKNLILPAIALGIRPLSIIVQLTRSSMLDVLSQDYIRTAKAKGLHYRVVLFRHALKNALNPVVTAISGWMASLMAGAFFIEFIFGWKGIGSVTVNALDKYDLPVVMGSVFFIAVFFVLMNIIVDICYGLIDPRIRVQ